jgi:4'-phosphopantetheinyl transferase EntD
MVLASSVRTPETVQITSRFSNILPQSVAFSGGSPLDLSEPLADTEVTAIRNARPIRIVQFRAGRHHARRAVAKLGIEYVTLPRGRSGAPIWPRGIVGSISHCGSYAAAVAARQADIMTIGIDVEDAPPLDGEMSALVCHPEEIRPFSATALTRSLPNIIFSVKESIYKAYWPVTESFLDFHDLLVQLDIEHRAFNAELVNLSRPALFGQRRFAGRFDCSHSLTFAATVVPRFPDPVG